MSDQSEVLRKELCKAMKRRRDIFAACIEEGVVDEIIWIIAPKFFTDSAATPVLAGQVPVATPDCLELESVNYEPLGHDLLVRGRPKARK